MGKKRVAYKGSRSAAQESRSGEGRGLRKVTGKKVERGRFYVQSTYNNTIITATDSHGAILATASAGMLGFRGPKRATPFAAAQIVRSLMERLETVGLKDIEVYVKGIGAGRESAIRSIANAGLNITFIKDITPIPHNGPRPRKPRRV